MSVPGTLNLGNNYSIKQISLYSDTIDGDSNFYDIGEIKMQIHADKTIIKYDDLTATTKTAYKSKNPIQNKNQQKDTVELSNTSRTMRNMLSMDIGTASHTTLYVDYSTFQSIATYTTNHPETQWTELGKDGEKRWIVVNGQRFESPLSEEEKAMMKRAEMTLLDFLQESEEHEEKTAPKEKVTLDFATKNGITDSSNDPKINSLLQNEEVMEILKNISKSTKGKISISS